MDTEANKIELWELVDGKLLNCSNKKGSNFLKPFILWEHTGSNRGPSACKADALNQLSYAPFFGRQR